MKAMLTGFIIGFVVVVGADLGHADDLESKVKVEKSHVGLHPGVDPWLYVCAISHLHVN